MKTKQRSASKIKTLDDDDDDNGSTSVLCISSSSGRRRNRAVKEQQGCSTRAAATHVGQRHVCEREKESSDACRCFAVSCTRGQDSRDMNEWMKGRREEGRCAGGEGDAGSPDHRSKSEGTKAGGRACDVSFHSTLWRQKQAREVCKHSNNSSSTSSHE